MAKGEHTGGMIALTPSAADVKRLAVPGGDDPDELHLTLGYLGDDVTGWPSGDVEALIAEMRECTGGGPISARVMGHAVFNPDGHGDRKPCAVYLVGDSDRIGPLRADVAALLGHKAGVPAQHEPYIPHVTAGFGLDPGALSYTGPVTFDRIRVALAGESTYLPLAGPPRESPGEIDETDIEEKGGPAVSDVQVKVKVASEAGERRYGLPIGTELGQARNQQAAEAQDAPGAREAYADLIRTNPRDYQRKLDAMSEDELQKLTRVAYSSRSSNPTVVQARLALAAALRRKGMDVNDFGGLGKSRSGGGAAAASGRASGGAGGRSRRAATPAKYQGRASVDADDSLPESDRQALLAAGWKGRPGDGAERLYPPTPSGARTPRGGSATKKDPTWVGREDWQARRTRRTRLGLMGTPGSTAPSAPTKKGEGGQVMRLHVYSDGSWQYKGAALDAVQNSAGVVVVEVKGGPPPWVKNKDDGKGGGGGDKGGTEGSTIKTVGDLATAVKKANSIKDPERRDAARKRCRAAAAKIGGPAKNMIPKDWGSGGGDKGKGNLAPPFQKGGTKSLFDGDDVEFAVHEAAAIELKVMSPDPKAAKLREYWAHGKGRAKWRPGTPGDFERLRQHLRKYVPAKMLNGLTANIHKLATGEWPGKHAHGGKAADLTGFEGKAVALDAGEVAEAAGVDPAAGASDDDAVSLALDHYAAMVDELTPEEEWLTAIAEEIDWEMLPDGTLQRADGQDEGTPDARDVEDDERAEDDPGRTLDLLEAAFAG